MPPPPTFTTRELCSTSSRRCKQGASVEEILEVLEIVTLLGVHSMSEGIPLLLKALEAEKA